MDKLTNPITYIAQKGVPLLRENVKLIGQYLFTLFFIGLGIWFIKHEQTELSHVKSILGESRYEWIVAGIALTVLYIALQGLMYRTSFRSVGNQLSFKDGVVLFLKRNFVSVFLPAGGVSSLVFFTESIERKGISKSQIYFASTIYAFVGILSVFFVAIPTFALALSYGTIGSGPIIALCSVFALIGVLYGLYRVLISRGAINEQLIRFFPKLETYLEEFKTNTIDKKQFLTTVLFSILIELVGVAHVFIAMLALGLEPSLLAALISYITATLFLIVSPFLRGLGAIEVSMTYLLVRFGFSDAIAISVTFLYRFLEFWLPLFFGAVSFLLKIDRLLMRVVPALLMLLLGVINVISVLTPAVAERLQFARDFLPLAAITVSNYFVIVSGLFLLVTAAFMLKGLRIAWYFALALCILSMIGHITKAIDYEEAFFALSVVVILIVSRKEYYVKNNPKLRTIGIQTTLLSCLTVVLYGCIGFYFLDKKHFDIDFSWQESIRYTLANFILIGSGELLPQDSFAQEFLYSINISGFMCLSFLIYSLVRPYIIANTMGKEDLLWAKQQLEKFGSSALDYFKVYPDKMIFRSQNEEGFVSYRVCGNFAVALECPVAPESSMEKLVSSFDHYCYESGLKSLYYRVPEEHLDKFSGKKHLFLGQEGVLNLSAFSLQGGTRSSIRNALKKVQEKGFRSKVYTAPHEESLSQKLRAVSDEWLSFTERSEIVFSQGMFLWDELKDQTLIVVENQEGKIVAFLNVIPDYAPGEGTYDLIRRASDAPNGVIDFILIALFEYLKSKGCTAVNLGFSPLSGIADPHNFPERSMKFAYEKIRSFSHYKGLRDSKEKFSPEWYNKYLVYDQDYDLLTVPSILSKVIKP